MTDVFSDDGTGDIVGGACVGVVMRFRGIFNWLKCGRMLTRDCTLGLARFFHSSEDEDVTVCGVCECRPKPHRGHPRPQEFLGIIAPSRFLGSNCRRRYAQPLSPSSNVSISPSLVEAY